MLITCISLVATALVTTYKHGNGINKYNYNKCTCFILHSLAYMFRLMRAIIRALYLQNTKILMAISPKYI
jgi:hypothetical protein